MIRLPARVPYLAVLGAAAGLLLGSGCASRPDWIEAGPSTRLRGRPASSPDLEPLSKSAVDPGRDRAVHDPLGLVAPRGLELPADAAGGAGAHRHRRREWWCLRTRRPGGLPAPPQPPVASAPSRGSTPRALGISASE
jgi:hypothetical protein